MFIHCPVSPGVTELRHPGVLGLRTGLGRCRDAERAGVSAELPLSVLAEWAPDALRLLNYLEVIFFPLWSGEIALF